MVSVLAIDRALETARQPKLLSKTAVSPRFPKDMIDVIKCAAGDEETVYRLALERQLTGDQIKEAARVYLQHVITHANGNDHIVLGLEHGATHDAVHEHRRWLLKWLHPDRNPSKWESALFHRVKEASRRLESTDPANVPRPVVEDLFNRKPKRPRSVKPQRNVAEMRGPAIRKREVLRLALVPIVLALLVTLGALSLWANFGPRGVQ